MVLTQYLAFAVSPGWADSLQKAQGSLSMFALANVAKTLSRIVVEPFVGVLTERLLCAVDMEHGISRTWV